MMDIKKEKKAIIVSDYPKYKEEFEFTKEEAQMNSVIEAIRALRNLRASFSIPATTLINVNIIGEKALWEDSIPYLKRLAKVENIEFIKDETLMTNKTLQLLLAKQNSLFHLKELSTLKKK